jgi:hypothetical protein
MENEIRIVTNLIIENGTDRCLKVVVVEPVGKTYFMWTLIVFAQFKGHV